MCSWGRNSTPSYNTHACVGNLFTLLLVNWNEMPEMCVERKPIFQPNLKINIDYCRDAQIPGARPLGRMDFVRWRLIFVGHQYGTCCVSSVWRQEFRGGFCTFEKFVDPWIDDYTRSVTGSFNLLKPTGHVMHQQFNIQQLYVLPTLYLCVLYLSENKQRLVPLTA